MTHADLAGWTAAALMISTFTCREARVMRPLAVSTNLAFIAYGALAALPPVLALHLLLLPINAWRCAQAHHLMSREFRMITVRSLRVLTMALLVLPLLAACGGGAEPEPEPEPPEFISVHRFVEISGIQADGRHLAAETNKFIGPEPYDEPGEYHASVEFGGLPFIPAGYDATAEGEIYSSETGKTFWVRAEAAKGELGTTDNIGTRTRLEQGQTFRKKSEGATLELVITEVLVELIDQNTQPLSIDECPWMNQPTANDCSGVMVATLDVGIDVWSPDGRSGGTNLIGQDGFVELRGWRDHWDVDIDSEWADLWSAASFDVSKDFVGDGSGSHLRVKLKQPIVLTVPLDRVKLEGDIYVNNTMMAVAFNHRQRESYAASYYRDPVRIGLGPELRTSGLEQIPWNAATAPDRADSAPLCAANADPLAGTLQFERTGFDVMELPGAGARIKVTRTGGSQGAVSVQFSTADGTAVAGQDYESVNRVVAFRDGEAGSKTVRVPIALDPAIEGAETVQLRLSDVRGCATLGVLSTAVLTIGDDDAPPPLPVLFSVGGSVSGLAGSGLVLEERTRSVTLAIGANGSFEFPGRYAAGAAYDVVVKTPPTTPAQVCSVTRGTGSVSGNVANIAVDCVTPPPPRGLDPTFGGGSGTVTAGPRGPMKAIALRPDGRIVAAIGNAVAQYLADGTLDTTFGNAGSVGEVLGSTSAGAEILDLALQPDGRIVLAGTARGTSVSSLAYDFAAARLNADGSRDAGFNGGQPLQVDWIGAPDRATRVLLQPDGRIVLTGTATTVYTSATDDAAFAAVRLNADGTLDTTFGSGGRAVGEIGQIDLGQAAWLQADGRIVVAGRTSMTRTDDSRFGAVRFMPDGTLDPGFGTGGKLHVPELGEASAMAQQPDGRFVFAVAQRVAGDFGFGVVRLNADGSADTGFGTGGLAVRQFGTNVDTPAALALQADGGIVLAGLTLSTATSYDFVVTRFGPDGTPDPVASYVLDFFAARDGAYDLLVQPDGKVLAAGQAGSGLNVFPMLLRLSP